MQTNLNFNKATELRDRNINKAVRHADTITRRWSERAYLALLSFIETRTTGFMTEEFSSYAQEHGLPAPPSLRAYGAIMVRAAREGIIRSTGIKQKQSARAHRCYANEWVAVRNN